MKKSILIIIITAVLSGCSPLRTQPLDINAASSLHGQTLTYTIRKKTDFAARTPVKATFGMIGAFSMISAGNEIILNNNIEDPAEFISVGLIKSLASANALKLVTPPFEVDDMDTGKIIAARKNARFIVDVKTISWEINYFLTDLTRYRVTYVAKVRLIDSESRHVIAEGFCSHSPTDTNGAATYDELVANGAARVKQQLAFAATECLHKIQKEIFTLQPEAALQNAPML